MYKQGVHNVRFAICNTDSQQLAQADIPVKIQLGSAGLGVGGEPEIEEPVNETSTETPRIEIQKPKILDRFLRKLSDMVEKID